MEAGLGVVVLAGEAQGGVGGGVGVPGGGAPEGGAGAPGDVAVFVDEFGGGADEVGDDGEEAGVDLASGWLASVMRSVWARGCRPSWSQVRVTGCGQLRCGGGLFDEGGAVPGEVDLLDDGFAVGGEALLGGAAAERVVEVAPDACRRGW